MQIGLSTGVCGMRGAGDVPVPPPASLAMPLNTPLVFVGDSITNITNIRAYRHWVNFYLDGHFYTPPGTNQGLGGASWTSEAATANGSPLNYYATRKEFTLGQLGASSVRKCLVVLAMGTNDCGKSGVTLQKMTDALNAAIAEIKALGHWVAVAKILKSSPNQAAGSIANEHWTGYNAYVDTLHNPANGVIVLGARVGVFDPATDSIGDGLHANAEGARKVGYADAQDLAGYLESGSLLYPDTTSYPFDWSANTKAHFSGTGGTAGTGASGTVADGWAVYCSSNGTAGGTSIGLTAVCTKTTDRFGREAQQIDVVGTATAAGVLTLIGQLAKGTGAGQYFIAGEFASAWANVQLSGANQANPLGVSSLGSNYGLLGGVMNKTIEASTGDIPTACAGVLRTVPVQSLKLNGAQNFEVSIGIKSGAVVNLRLIVSRVGAQFEERVAYAVPFNMSGGMGGGVLPNPLNRRPALTGTMAAGQTITLNPGCVIGGGLTVSALKILDSANNVITSKTADANPMTYVLTASESGKTIRMTEEVSNSYGSAVIDDGSGSVVA